MTITREQVADLREGDVVEVGHEDWPEGTVVRGPLWLFDGETLQVARIVVRHWDMRHPFDNGLSLTVVSRAPRPLYVNHPRTKPAAGDVASWDGNPVSYGYAGDYFGPDAGPRGDVWIVVGGTSRLTTERLHQRSAGALRLLVDGETAQVVP